MIKPSVIEIINVSQRLAKPIPVSAEMASYIIEYYEREALAEPKLSKEKVIEQMLHELKG